MASILEFPFRNWVGCGIHTKTLIGEEQVAMSSGGAASMSEKQKDMSSEMRLIQNKCCSIWNM